MDRLVLEVLETEALYVKGLHEVIQVSLLTGKYDGWIVCGRTRLAEDWPYIITSVKKSGRIRPHSKQVRLG